MRPPRNSIPPSCWRHGCLPTCFRSAGRCRSPATSPRGASARLAGAEVPSWPDHEKTFAELQERIRKTTDFVQTFKAAQIDGSEDRDVRFDRRPARHLQGPAVSDPIRAAELLLPRHHRLRHPAPQRRGARQARLRRRGAGHGRLASPRLRWRHRGGWHGPPHHRHLGAAAERHRLRPAGARAEDQLPRPQAKRAGGVQLLPRPDARPTCRTAKAGRWSASTSPPTTARISMRPGTSPPPWTAASARITHRRGAAGLVLPAGRQARLPPLSPTAMSPPRPTWRPN